MTLIRWSNVSYIWIIWTLSQDRNGVTLSSYGAIVVRVTPSFLKAGLRLDSCDIKQQNHPPPHIISRHPPNLRCRFLETINTPCMRTYQRKGHTHPLWAISNFCLLELRPPGTITTSGWPKLSWSIPSFPFPYCTTALASAILSKNTQHIKHCTYSLKKVCSPLKPEM